MAASGSGSRWTLERVGIIATVLTLLFAIVGFGGYLPAAKSHHWWPDEQPVPLFSRTAAQISLPDNYSLATWLSSIAVSGHDIGHATLSTPTYSLLNGRAYVSVSMHNISTSTAATFSADCSRNSGTAPAPGPYLIHLHEPPAGTRAIAQDGGNWWDGNGAASTAIFTMEGVACSENAKPTGTTWHSVTTTPAFAWQPGPSEVQTLVFPIPDDAAAKLLAFVFIANNGDYVVSAL